MENKLVCKYTHTAQLHNRRNKTEKGNLTLSPNVTTGS